MLSQAHLQNLKIAQVMIVLLHGASRLGKAYGEFISMQTSALPAPPTFFSSAY
jgi:hypothetical protein